MIRRITNKLKNCWRGYCYQLTTILQKISFFFNGVQYGKNLKVCGTIFLQNTGTISLGNNVHINSSFVSNPIYPASRSSFVVRGGATGNWR